MDIVSQAKSHLFTVGDGESQDVEHFAEAYSLFKEQVSTGQNKDFFIFDFPGLVNLEKFQDSKDGGQRGDFMVLTKC